MKTIVLTGSTGLIGKEAIAPLLDNNFEIFYLNSDNCNLFNFQAVNNFFSDKKPEYLLHLAWITGGDYLQNPINSDYVEASMNMLQAFGNNGGKRAIYAGTCFEYAYKDSPINENDKLAPKSLYAKCKVDLCNKATDYCIKNNISFSWGRIFYVYGHNEKQNRFTRLLIDNFNNNNPVEISYGQLKRDYMYSKDIAKAFIKLLQSDVLGCVNICTGNSISLGDFAIKLAKKMNKSHLLTVSHKETDQPLIIIGDNTRLKKEVKFDDYSILEDNIDRIIYKL